MAASLDKSSAPLPAHDIFGTPENEVFLSTNPYSALAENKKEIRLLQVLPEDQEGMIACTLQQSRLLSEIQGQYVALSYCAGDPRNTKEIIVNGTVCNVFANLEHALNEARYFWKQTHRDEDLFMWVDQICINQMDLGERSHQVGFMRDIYENSRQVLVCLSTSGSLPHGMKWFQRVADEVRDLDREVRKPTPAGISSIFDRYATANAEEYLEKWSSFWDFIESPWWTRAWIFQEFIVAPNADLLYCYQHMNWTRFHLAISAVLCFHAAWDGQLYHIDLNRGSGNILPESRPEDSWPILSMILSMMNQKYNWRGCEDSKALLLRSRETSASNPRDKIYAVIGLADPGYNIIPNYSLSISEVLIETTRRIIEHESNLHILAYALNTRRRPKFTLPSWVVDWTQPQAVDGLCFKRTNTWDGNTARVSFQSTLTGDLSLVTWGVFFGFVCGGSRSRNITKTSLDFITWTIAPDGNSGIRSDTIFMMCAVGVEKMDELWILQGSRAPVILRPRKDNYRLISPVCEMHIGEKRTARKRRDEYVRQMKQAQSNSRRQRISII